MRTTASFIVEGHSAASDSQILRIPRDGTSLYGVPRVLLVQLYVEETTSRQPQLLKHVNPTPRSSPQGFHLADVILPRTTQYSVHFLSAPDSSCIMPSATASGADAAPNGSARSREHKQGNQDRTYTAEQKIAVIRVRRCSPTAFYDILDLEEVKKTVSDGEIKKAYRKLSLLTHPDKNSYDGADEAFKSKSDCRRYSQGTSTAQAPSHAYTLPK